MKILHPSFTKFWFLLLSLSALNCGTEPTLPQNNKSLVNTQWQLIAYADQFDNLTVIDIYDSTKHSGGYRISFNDTTMNGYDACNLFSTSYKVKDGSILQLDDNYKSTLKDCYGNLDFIGALFHTNFFEFPAASLTHYKDIT